MPLLITNLNKIIICANAELVIFDTNTKLIQKLELPAQEIPVNLSKNQQDALKQGVPIIITGCFSKCSKYFAVCTTNKQLVIYDEAFEVVKNITCVRSVSRIRFTPGNEIVVADKSGDVYLFNLKNKHEHLLGHLSMLLDVVVSDDGKYIVTCDRDEKIRVSHFPGSYNIVSYCLGHEEFVVNLGFLDKVLISGSGDGTIRVWNYLTGDQINVVNTNHFIPDKSLVEKFTAVMDAETVEINTLPITSLKLTKINKKTLIVVSIYSLNALQCYEVIDENNIVFLHSINVENKLLTFDLTNKLYILTDQELLTYEFDNNKFVKFINFVSKSELNDFYTNCKEILDCNNLGENISVLYKRKYDNVLEYQERKKLRIEQQKKL